MSWHCWSASLWASPMTSALMAGINYVCFISLLRSLWLLFWNSNFIQKSTILQYSCIFAVDSLSNIVHIAPCTLHWHWIFMRKKRYGALASIPFVMVERYHDSFMSCLQSLLRYSKAEYMLMYVESESSCTLQLLSISTYINIFISKWWSVFVITMGKLTPVQPTFTFMSGSCLECIRCN